MPCGEVGKAEAIQESHDHLHAGPELNKLLPRAPRPLRFRGACCATLAKRGEGEDHQQLRNVNALQHEAEDLKP